MYLVRRVAAGDAVRRRAVCFVEVLSKSVYVLRRSTGFRRVV